MMCRIKKHANALGYDFELSQDNLTSSEEQSKIFKKDTPTKSSELFYKATITEREKADEKKEDCAAAARKTDLLKIEVNLYSDADNKIWVQFRCIAGSIHSFMDFYREINRRLG